MARCSGQGRKKRHGSSPRGGGVFSVVFNVVVGGAFRSKHSKLGSDSDHSRNVSRRYASSSSVAIDENGRESGRRGVERSQRGAASGEDAGTGGVFAKGGVRSEKGVLLRRGKGVVETKERETERASANVERSDDDDVDDDEEFDDDCAEYAHGGVGELFLYRFRGW